MRMSGIIIGGQSKGVRSKGQGTRDKIQVARNKLQETGWKLQAGEAFGLYYLYKLKYNICILVKDCFSGCGGQKFYLRLLQSAALLNEHTYYRYSRVYRLSCS